MEKPLLAAMDQILAFWPYVVTLLSVLFSLLATGHAVLSKRDTRAAIGWVGVIWLAPILGVLLYVWLGINRIERATRPVAPHGTSSSGFVLGSWRVSRGSPRSSRHAGGDAPGAPG